MAEEKKKAFYLFTKARENEEGPRGALMPPLVFLVGRREGRGSSCEGHFQCWKHWCCSGVLNHSGVKTLLFQTVFASSISDSWVPMPLALGVYTCLVTLDGSDVVELELP